MVLFLSTLKMRAEIHKRVMLAGGYTMKANGYDITIDSYNDQDDGKIFINFDRNGLIGGYIHVRLTDTVEIEVYNGDGDMVSGLLLNYDDLKPTGEFGHVDERL